MTSLEHRTFAGLGVGVGAAIVVGAGHTVGGVDVLDAVRSVIAVTVVLALPGAAAAAVLMPARMGAAERVALTLGLSLVITIVVGLALAALRVGLSPLTWLAGLGGVTAALVALRAVVARRPRFTEPSAGREAPRSQAAPGRINADAGPLLPPSRRVLAGAAVIALMSALSLAAFVIARDGALAQQFPPFSALSIARVPGAADEVSIGVQNAEPVLTTYRLELRRYGDVVREWTDQQLDPGELWSVRLPASAGGADAELYLYRSQEPDVIYRRLDWPATSP